MFARWYVTNGETVVGPVDTDLLVRGITANRIPDDCMVMQEAWTSWRSLPQIRELSRISPKPSWVQPQDELASSGVPENLVRNARDAGEALLFAMHAAVMATRATAGLVHRAREPFVGLVTSCAHGLGLDGQLGQVLPRLDPAMATAQQGSVLVARARTAGEPERAIARRFSVCGELAGVAMVPVFDGARLLAMIELARTDHPFRVEDADILQRIAAVVCLR
ncbi:MAG TPA: GYF domain-containing protein [Polyangiaceae bacterium]